MPSSIHYLQPLWAALYTRALGDNGSGGLNDQIVSPLVTGFFNCFPTPVTGTVPSVSAGSMPNVVYSVASAAPDPTFTTASDKVTVRMAVYVAAWDNDAEHSYDPLVCGAKIIDRLIGDWSSQSTRVPAYGFDRFTPTLSGTSWVATAMELAGVHENHEPGQHYCWIVEFDLWVSKSSV